MFEEPRCDPFIPTACHATTPRSPDIFVISIRLDGEELTFVCLSADFSLCSVLIGCSVVHRDLYRISSVHTDVREPPASPLSFQPTPPHLRNGRDARVLFEEADGGRCCDLLHPLQAR